MTEPYRIVFAKGFDPFRLVPHDALVDIERSLRALSQPDGNPGVGPVPMTLAHGPWTIACDVDHANHAVTVHSATRSREHESSPTLDTLRKAALDKMKK